MVISCIELRSPTILSILFFLVLLGFNPIPSSARKRHAISFRSPGLFPDALTWDPSGQHFLVGSLRSRTIHSVSDAGVVQPLISDPNLPENATIRGLAIDSTHGRLFAVIHSAPPLPPFNALAAYDLHRGDGNRRIFLSLLPSLPADDTADTRDVANDVAIDFKGNAYVTNSAKNFIWKVDKDGEASIFSRSPIFAPESAAGEEEGGSGLNGIVYVSKGYLLAVQGSTGKMFKVDEEKGTARQVLLSRDVKGAKGMAVRKRGGVVMVVGQKQVWFVKSQDSWSEGVIDDETTLEGDGLATSVAAAAEDRVYVLYEGVKDSEWFGIEEVWSEKESGEERIWLYVLLAFGFAYFCFWRFQMKQLVINMDKKTH